MTTSSAVRRCPDCGGPLFGRPGVAWMVCAGCPLALDPFGQPPRRVPTYRPVDGCDRTLRLPFYVFGLRGSGGGSPGWVPAFRCFGLQPEADAAGELTRGRFAPPLQAAPLGALLARGVPEASALLGARLGAGAGAHGDPILVSLGCELRGSRLYEPVSGARLIPGAIAPPPLGLTTLTPGS